MTLESAESAASPRVLRTAIEAAIADLLSSGESVDLRRESRRVFEEQCLDEVLWESFVDEWIDLVYDMAGQATNVRDYESLTDWCVCGHSYDDHRLDCQNSECDCERFKRSRSERRPKQRKASKWTLEQRALKRDLLLALDQREGRRISNLVGEDLTGGV